MSNYRPAPVRVISNPTYDAAVVEGRAKGYTEGLILARQQAAEDKAQREAEHAAAMENLRSTLENALASLGQAANSLNARQAEQLDSVEEELFARAVKIAEVILRAEVLDASVAARSMIKRALEADTPSPVHTIRMNADAVRAAKDNGLVPDGVEVIADPSLDRGEAIALYQEGWLLAGLEDAVRRVQQVADDAVEASDK